MNKVEHVADERVRGLKEQGGIELEPDDALIVAVLGQVHEDKFAWPVPDGRNSKASTKLGKKWLYGTGDLPDIPNMASQPLPDYLRAAIREDESTLPRSLVPSLSPGQICAPSGLSARSQPARSGSRRQRPAIPFEGTRDVIEPLAIEDHRTISGFGGHLQSSWELLASLTHGRARQREGGGAGDISRRSCL
jgi:hypothetical protein